MTPNDLNKELTYLLSDRLHQYGFNKKSTSNNSILENDSKIIYSQMELFK